MLLNKRTVRSCLNATMLSVSVLISGCASVEPLPSDTFYRLETRGSANTLGLGRSWGGAPIRVAKFSGSGVHRERAIAYTERGSPAVKQYRYHYWIDSPERVMQQELISYLRRLEVAPLVMGSRVKDPDLIEVRGHIKELDRTIGSDGIGVSVVLGFEVLKPDAENALVLANEYRASLAVADEQMSATVAAISDAVGEIFAQLAHDTAEALSVIRTARSAQSSAALGDAGGTDEPGQH